MKAGQFIARLLGREARAQAVGVSPIWGATWSGHRHVNAHLAENLSAVSACVGAISSVLASLPVYVYRTSNGGRTELTGLPINRLLRQPWGILTWPDFVEWLMSSVLLTGNALCEIQYDNAGRVTALRPIPWKDVSPIVLPSGRLAFDIMMWPDLVRRRLLDDEVLYIKDRSDDGYVGRSRIGRSPDVISNAASLQDFASHAWENQASPSGAVQLEAPLSQESFDRIRARLQAHYSGTSNARRVMLLDANAKWQSISVSPEDAEVLASRRFTTEELCRLFQVPPPIVQSYEYNTFTNSQQAALWFAQFSLMPWVKKIEAEFQRSVIIGSDVELQIDMSGLMRGDYAARWQAYAIARQNNILSVNEIREAEGYGPARGDMMPTPTPSPPANGMQQQQQQQMATA